MKSSSRYMLELSSQFFSPSAGFPFSGLLLNHRLYINPFQGHDVGVEPGFLICGEAESRRV